MRRALLILFTALSCLVLVCISWLWPRSHGIATGWAWDDMTGRRREVVSYAGAIHVRELTGLPVGVTSGTRTPIREDVPQDADWQTRCGGNMSIVWQGCGFAIASGSTPMILLTSLPYPVQQVQGVMGLQGGITTTSFVPTVQVASQPVVVSGMTIAASDALVLQPGSGGLTASGNVTITGGGVPGATLTAQSIVFSPNLMNTWQLAVVVPYWSVVALASLLPAYCLATVPAAVRRRRRIRRGLCVNCGYDMRASAERCPECGTATLPTR
jgi:hypothetical protein